MDEVDLILRDRRLQDLIGRPEGVHLEAKGQPYDLADAGGRFELAKDVSAFANGQGGHLLIGVVTERPPEAQEEVIRRFEPFDQKALRPAAYTGVLDEYVYPRLTDLTVTLVTGSDGEARVAVIRLPPQDRDRGPFLVLRVVDGGRSLRQSFVGYFERRGDANEPMDPQRLHRAFQNGLSSAAQRMTRIEGKLDVLLERSDPNAPAMAQADQIQDARIEQILQGEE